MATGMRITAAVSLVLLLASPSRVYSAQLPVPATCFERCPANDVDCIDVCQREIESENETEEFPGDKRASAFVRIGRPALDKRASSFIRIGKKEVPVEVLEGDKRKDNFVRLNRASAFVRIGRGRESADTDGLKRASSFIRIGKSSAPAAAADTDSPIEIETTGNKRKSSAFVRIGRRRDHAVESGQRWLPVHQK